LSELEKKDQKDAEGNRKRRTSRAPGKAGGTVITIISKLSIKQPSTV